MLVVAVAFALALPAVTPPAVPLTVVLPAADVSSVCDSIQSDESWETTLLPSHYQHYINFGLTKIRVRHKLEVRLACFYLTLYQQQGQHYTHQTRPPNSRTSTWVKIIWRRTILQVQAKSHAHLIPRFRSWPFQLAFFFSQKDTHEVHEVYLLK